MILEELQKFCADESDPRDYLWQPFSQGGFTWATNGHVIVRVPLIAGVPEQDRPDAVGLLAKQSPATTWLPVPAVKYEREDCHRCGGSGRHECSCGHEHECGECAGSGKVDSCESLAIADAHFALRYLAMLQDWEISPNGDKCAWIRKGDTLGLLMPMVLNGYRDPLQRTDR